MVLEIKAENGNGSSRHRGPTTVDLGTGYSAEIFYRSSYISQKEKLAHITEGLVVSSGLFSPSIARHLVSTGLEKSDPNNTSWIGFRKTDEPFGKYKGLAWQEELSIPTVEGEKIVLYMKLRAFEKDAQRHHLGRTAIQLVLNTHIDSQILAHRTASPAAALSWLESGVFEPGRRLPRDLPFDKDPVAPQILMWLWTKYHINGRVPNFRTGVSIGDYPEQNGAYEPDPTHAPTMEICRWMTGKLGMNFRRGDSLMQIADLR